MKRIRKIISLLLALSLCLSLLPVNALAREPGRARLEEPAGTPLRAAQTASIDFSTQNYENGQTVTSVELDEQISITFDKGTNNNNTPKYYNTGTAVRCYGGNYFTVTAASGYTITDVSLSFGSGDGSNAITTDVETYADGVWTGEAEALTFTIDGTSGHRRIKTISVSYTDGGSSGPALSGSGTAEDPYLLSNLDELLLFAAMVNGTGDYEGSAQPGLCAKLTADVDASEAGAWTPIGITADGYGGSFDGQEHSVTLTMQDSTAYYQGFFGLVKGGTVENLHVAGSIDTDSEDVGSVGGVAGCLNGGTIQNCSGNVAINVDIIAGGVVGYMKAGTVSNCYNTGTISGDQAGGVVGYMENGTVASCYNTGAVTESGKAGGIAGFMSGGSVTGCYNTGTVSGVYSGGIAGYLQAGSVTGCYNVGAIDGAISGGVIGENDGGTVTNCYYDKTLCDTVTGAINGADTGNVKGLTTTQMTGAAALTNMGGFDADVWVLTGAYPKLKPYTAPTLAALTTDAEGNYLIGSADDWNTLAEIVFGGAELSGASFRQTADFTVGVVLGCADHPFTGSYDGDGHTLTLALEDAAQDFVAPFNSVNAAKLRHLCVTGTVFGKMHCAGLVGSVRGGKTVVDDCLIDVAVASSGSGTHCGGVIGHAGTFETVVTGCVFTGSIGAGKTAATFWGWSDDGAEGGLANCLDLSDSSYPIGLGSGDLVTVNTYYTASNKQAGSGRPWAEANRGKLAYAVTPGTAVSLGFQSGYTIDLGAPVTGLTGGVPGLLRGNTIYAAAGETLRLALGYTGAEPLNGFEASAGTLTETDGGYTLLMPAQDVRITALVPTSVSSWTELEEALLAGGTILLTADVSPDNPYFADALVVPTGVSATLDLNGHIVDRGMTEVNSWHGGVIEINGGSLTVIDSDPTAAHESAVSYEDPLTGESVTVSGGILTGGWPEQYGGGVCVKGGSFTLTGGSIVGNHVGKTGFGAMEALGGGVYVQSGSFTMSGGAICGNQAVNRNTMMPNLLGRGGGVYVNGGSFTMSNGVICGNSAGELGGGVYLATPNSGSDGSMNVSGGATVTGNAVQGAASNVYLEEGGKLSVTDALTGSIGVSMQSPGVFTDGLPGHGTAANFSSDDPGYIPSLTDEGEAQLAEEFYPLWIAGVQFSSANRTVDATDNAAISSGTAVYDRESNTLTLTDFVYSGVGSLGKFQIFSVLCYAENGKEFTLALVGENSLTQTGVENGYSSTAVFLENRTTATIYSENGGSLRAEGGPVENGSSSSGGFSTGITISYSDLVIDGANVTAVGGTAQDYSKGIEIDRYFTLNSGSLTAVGGQTIRFDSFGIQTGRQGFTVHGGTLTALGGNANRNSYGVEGYDASTTTVTVTGGRFVAQGDTKALANVAALSADGLSVLAGEDAASAVPVTGDGWKDKKYVTVLPPVSYLDPTDADEPEKSCALYTVLNDQTTLTAGWYVVAPGALTIDERITVTGEVNLILCDGATLTAPLGVNVGEGNSLTLWAQSSGDGMGKLFAGTDGTTDAQGNYNRTCNEQDAAIGGNDEQTAGSITVNGGFVTAIGDDGAGIGGGIYGDGGFITVNGGSVTAIGDGGAGIGGGDEGDGGFITVNGGTLTASSHYDAGIGGGENGDGGSITITGGSVTATSSEAQAIGHGCSAANEGSLEIPGMKVYADDTATTPVQADARESTCRSTWAKLELCESHDWGAWSVTNAPTCTEDGVKIHSCNWCAVSEDGVAEALGHDLIHHDAQEPTCTEIGWEAYDTCSRCDYTTYAELPALGHDLIHHDAQEPTCTEIGWEAYDSCSRCDYTTYAELPALGHDLVHHDAKAPTCMEIGWEAYDTCARCDYTTYAELPALGHDLVPHDAQEPTCTEIGWEAYDTCSRCAYSTYAEREAIGHAWGEPSYEWSDDYSSVTATAVCANDPSHILSETVQSDFIITQPSTFEQTGSGYYQATFENELFQTQKQEVVIPEVACAGGDECPSKHFTDMPPITNYAHIPIDWAFVNHITGGTSATTFSPNATCTRAQFVTFLWRVAGSPEPETTQSPFKDVKAKAWYYKSVLWAVENGITGGTSASTFSPGAICSRAQVVTFLWRYADSPEPTLSENPFEDVKTKAWYCKAVLWAVENGITAGTSETGFSPNGDCTRAQVMTFLYRKFGQ